MQDIEISTQILGYLFLYGPMFVVGMGLMLLAAILNGFKMLWMNILGHITWFLSTPSHWFFGIILYLIWRNRT